MSDIPTGFEPKQQRGIDARDRVYAEAMRLFGAYGVEGTKVEEIIADAGVAWGTFFRYFPRKEDVLLYAARIEMVEHLIPLVEHGVDEGVDARELAESFFTAMLMPGDREPALHGAIIRESVASHDRYLAILKGIPATFDLVARIVEHGLRQGTITASEPTVTLAGVLACAVIYPALYGYYDETARTPQGEPRLEKLELIIRLSLDIAWRGLTSG